MKIKINIKSVSKTRGIEPQIYEIKSDIRTLENLITNLVDIEIDKYENSEFKALNQQDINEMLESGKISFGFKYREIFNLEQGQQNKKIDRDHAKEIALLAFTDGLYVVFINKIKIKNLSDNINITESNELTLIRLTMLSGRYF